MKQCPKCDKKYDDSWVLCLNDGTQLLQKGLDGPVVAQKKKYASLFERAIADFLDGIILFVVSLIVAGFFVAAGALMMKRSITSTPVLTAWWTVTYLMTLVLTVPYRGYFLGRNGQTPGKKALKIKVVKDDLSAVGYKRAYARSAAYMILYELLGLPILLKIGTFLYIASAIVAALRQDKKTFHDLIGGTRVVSI